MRRGTFQLKLTLAWVLGLFRTVPCVRAAPLFDRDQGTFRLSEVALDRAKMLDNHA